MVVGVVAQRAHEDPASAGAGSGIPSAYVAIYRAVADAYNVHWLLVAAVHAQETDFSRLRVSGINGDAVSTRYPGLAIREVHAPTGASSATAA